MGDPGSEVGQDNVPRPRDPSTRPESDDVGDGDRDSTTVITKGDYYCMRSERTGATEYSGVRSSPDHSSST